MTRALMFLHQMKLVHIAQPFPKFQVDFGSVPLASITYAFKGLLVSHNDMLFEDIDHLKIYGDYDPFYLWNTAYQVERPVYTKQQVIVFKGGHRIPRRDQLTEE